METQTKWLIGGAAVALGIGAIIALTSESQATPPPPPVGKANIYGIVSSPTGPVVGTLITAGGLTATTDTTGSYQILALSPGSYTLQVSKIGYETQVITMQIVAGNNVKNIALLPVTALYGQVTDKISGTPIVGATVILGTLSATTDANGEYSFDNLTPGSFAGVAEATGYVTQDF